MNIQKQVSLIGLVLGGVIATLIAVAVLVGWRMASLQQQTEISAEALKNHWHGDMMHDALRGNVVAALYAATTGNAAMLKQAQTDIAENADTFRSAVQANAALPLEPALAASVRAIRAPLEAYIVAAEETATMAGSDVGRARALWPAFDTRFEAMEQAQGALGETIEEAVAMNTQASHAMARWSLPVILVFGFIAFAALAVVYRVLTRRVVAPIDRLATTLQALSAGNVDVSVSDTDRTDEIGALARGVEAFRGNVEVARKAEEARVQAELAGRTALRDMATSLEQSVLEIVGSLQMSTASLKESAADMSQTAAATKSDASTAAESADETFNGIQIVAAASHELSASIDEIARRIEDASTASAIAFERANQARDRVASLANAAEQIGAVSALITEIAEQTNLLALNATIEAARAGDAGRGFAVVANEVKGLAAQTTRATENIGGLIQSIRDVAAEVGTAIGGTYDSIEALSESNSSIASAITQQCAATNEISGSAETTSQASQRLHGMMGNVQEQARVSESRAGSVLDSTHELESRVASLRDEVVDFIARVRAA